MKLYLVSFFCLAVLICCNTNAKEPETNNVKIVSVTHEEEEIKGNYVGKRYRFVINVDNTANIDLLSFCKNNFPSILNGVVDKAGVVDKIMEELNLENNKSVHVTNNPNRISLVTDIGVTDVNYDIIEFEMIAGKNNKIALELLYYFPL